LKVTTLNFDVGIIESSINLAIFFDILYSIFFIVPGIAFVAIQRWPFGRRVFLNFVLWVTNHPKGVIYAFGEMLLGIVTAIRQSVIGK